MQEHILIQVKLVCVSHFDEMFDSVANLRMSLQGIPFSAK
jgi:hypothetical protein